MSNFAKLLNEKHSSESLNPEFCHKLILALLADLAAIIKGQPHAIRRIIQTAILNGHLLIEGVPGQGKTKAVEAFAHAAGNLRFKWIQFRPDLLPGDLIGGRILDPDLSKGPKFKKVYGPLYAVIVIADEANRAPPKTQAACLQPMVSHLLARIDSEDQELETVYHPEDRKVLERLAGRYCFRCPIPSPDNPKRVPFMIFATQNPIEMDGTYPLGEAHTNRFTFMILMLPVARKAFKEVLYVNLPEPLELLHEGEPEPEVAQQIPDAGDALVREYVAEQQSTNDADDVLENPADPRGLALKSVIFWEWLRNELFAKENSAHYVFNSVQRGLFDRFALVLELTHFKAAERSSTSDVQEIEALNLGDEQQLRIRASVAQWLEGDDPPPVNGAAAWKTRLDIFKKAVRRMLASRLFEYVEHGASVRVLVDWPRAAISEAFIEEGPNFTLKRRHFRSTADDVMRHRITLTPQAKADNIKTVDLIHLLVDTILPDEKNLNDEIADDQIPFLP